MKKSYQFLKGSIFDAPFMQTRIKSHSMTFLEKLLGFFLGPAGVIVFYAAIVNLRELYYTSVVPVDNLFGLGTYLTITSISSVVGIASGLGVSWMMERTVCKAGRVRPYLLMAQLLLITSGVALFACPFANGSTAQLIWLAVFNILYLGVGTNVYAIRFNKIPLATRNLNDRASVTTVYNAADNIISGVIVGMLISSVIYYRVLVHDTTGANWRMLIYIFAAIALPLALIEYFFTRERVTEENLAAEVNLEGKVETIPLKTQLKALFSNKYYVLALVMTVFGTLATHLAGTNCRTNYCQWVLGATAENNLQMIYMAVAMAPMGFGVFLIFPMVKRFGATVRIQKCVMIKRDFSLLRPSLPFSHLFLLSLLNT